MNRRPLQIAALFALWFSGAFYTLVAVAMVVWNLPFIDAVAGVSVVAATVAIYVVGIVFVLVAVAIKFLVLAALGIGVGIATVRVCTAVSAFLTPYFRRARK